MKLSKYRKVIKFLIAAHAIGPDIGDVISTDVDGNAFLCGVLITPELYSRFNTFYQSYRNMNWGDDD